MWTSRASSATTTMLARERSRASVSRWCTAPTASSDGTGTRSSEARSWLITRMDTPLRTACSASVASRSTARRRPAGPLSTEKVASRVCVGKDRSPAASSSAESG